MENGKKIITCVQPNGKFLYGIHKPHYSVQNMRDTTSDKSSYDTLGEDESGVTINNRQNFPPGDVEVHDADWIYEIPNPFPFRGRTFIDKVWADNAARYPERIPLFHRLIKENKDGDGENEKVSMHALFDNAEACQQHIHKLPSALQLALATTTSDANDLLILAHISCRLLKENGTSIRLQYYKQDGRYKAIIHNHQLFEAVANNPYLPDDYKVAMVLRPGVQGGSEIVGEWQSKKSHVYEYLRKNSYIAGGHYAANMAEDEVRYSTLALNETDFIGLRHLYYQRTFVRLAVELECSTSLYQKKSTLTEEELEELRCAICEKIVEASEPLPFSSTLWGWNYGFDYAPTGYRLHASHQQIHQQYALIPDAIDAFSQGCTAPCEIISAYSCGDHIAETIRQYQSHYHSDFFDDYRKAIVHNKRMDENRVGEGSDSLIIWQNESVMLFVPKAQTSQWEVQVMTLPVDGMLPGNIIECDTVVRHSVDIALLFAQQVLAVLGVKMVTSIEFSKRIGDSTIAQPLLYSLLPRLPESPGAFSEAQLRYINGHYPEDFATLCRKTLQTIRNR